MSNDFYPVPGRVLILFLVWLVLAVPVGVFFLPRNDPLLLLGALYGIALVAVVLAVLPLGRSALPALAIRRAKWRPFVVGPLVTLALSVGASQLGPEVQGMKAVEEIVRQPDALLPSVILLGALAPLAEELVFRGLLYGWLEGRWGWKVAFAVSSIAFAAAHFEPAHILLVLPLAVLFGWLRRRTASLLPSIVAHAVNNSAAVLSLVWLGS